LCESWNISRYESRITGQQVCALVHGAVSHEVGDVAMALEAGVIEIAPVFDANQVGHLHRQERIGALAKARAGRNGIEDIGNLRNRHGGDASLGIRPEPRRAMNRLQ
jgi:hypothetical protein